MNDVLLFPVNHLRELAAYFDGEYHIGPYRKSRSEQVKTTVADLDFSDVAGQETVKRALQVAAARLTTSF